MLSGISSLGLATAVGGVYAWTRAARRPEQAKKVADPTERAPQEKTARIPVRGRAAVPIGPGVSSSSTLLVHRGQTLLASEEPTRGYAPWEKTIRIRKDQIRTTGAEKGPHQTRRPTPFLKRINQDAMGRFDMNKMQARSDSRHLLKGEEYDDREFAYVRSSNPGATLFRPVRVAQGLHWGYRKVPMDEFQR
jgi:hypothetical protein